MITLIPLLTTFLIGMALVPIIKELALACDFVDRPAKRKIHRAPVPLMGGVAIYASTSLSMLIFDGASPRTWSILIGGTALVAVGLMDDWQKTRSREFPVWPRIIVYAIVSAVPLWFDITISGISNPFSGSMMLFPTWLASFSTMLWIFALMNMVNFIDGVDGLAAGLVMMSSLTLVVAALIKQQYGSAVMGAILAGACLSFLLYNFYPAQIFMGDAGAVFLGYCVAVLAVDGAFKSATVISMLVPVLALGVPIFDTLIVFWRRLLSGRSLYKADNLHTHHTLLNRGFTQVQTASFLYVTGIVLSMLSILLVLFYA